MGWGLHTHTNTQVYMHRQLNTSKRAGMQLVLRTDRSQLCLHHSWALQHSPGACRATESMGSRELIGRHLRGRHWITQLTVLSHLPTPASASQGVWKSGPPCHPGVLGTLPRQRSTWAHTSSMSQLPRAGRRPGYRGMSTQEPQELSCLHFPK